MNICMPYEKGSHHRALTLYLKPLAESRGHTVSLYPNTRIDHRSMGVAVQACDIVVTTSPWWEYVHMWISAAKHFGKPWLYHPEGWDNAHPVISPGDEGHAKNKGWPYIPDRTCCPGPAFNRIMTSRIKAPESSLVNTGMSRFDAYGKNWDRIRSDYFGSSDKPVVLVATATLWDHKPMIRALWETGKYRVIVRQHFTDPVEMYTYNMEGMDYEVILPGGIDENSPEKEHRYDPTEDDLISYASQLKSADVVVNVAGTTTIEASILGTPVVNLYRVNDDAREVEHRKLFGHYGPGAHYNDVKAGETSFLAETVDDLPRCVDLALNGIDRQREIAIKKMIYDICSISFLNGVPTHNATDSILKEIESCA